MSTCTQPGCQGTIVDGYCDVCGMPGAPESSAAPARTGASTATTPVTSVVSRTPSVPNGTRCAQPGCRGTIADGYCDVCGSPAVPAAPAAAAAAEEDSPVSSPMGASTATRPTSPSHLGVTALGSQRAGATTGSTRRVRTGSRRLRQARLGAGLTSIPPAPSVDPATVVMKNPVIPEEKRYCPQCNAPVGRASGDKPGREEGFCAKCGSAFSFTAKLKPGDLVAGQYLVVGALAHGGLGWIYLAKDRNVSDRWVVLKGLLNSGDPDALAAAIAEQRYLAQVEHPLIVEIFNFVTHDNAGYIVMEYVGGVSLKQVLKDRMKANGGAYDPLPVDQALAYILEVLPAFQYLHDLGLVYCDFKPDNLIQVGDGIKLIDLGGVRHIDDTASAIYGTVGYQAPEVAELGPSIASDIWTIGRTLIVLCMEFRGYQSTYVKSLPDPATTPLFQEYDSLYRLIAKCCAPDPSDRFASIDELKAQLLGVLREVVARHTEGTALTSAASLNFLSPTVASNELDWSMLPELRPDATDAQHAWLTSLAPGTPQERLAELASAPEATAEVWLARGMEALRAGDVALATKATSALLQLDPWEWRALWVSGLASLQARDHDAAQSSFNAVYQQVPGELAPKLALALSCELGGEDEVAERLYQTCAETDAAYVAVAAFGMARIRAARGDVGGAVAALDQVPQTSRGFGQSRRERADVLLRGSNGDLRILGQAMSSVEGIRLDAVERETLNVRIYEQALARLRAPGGWTGGEVHIGAMTATEPNLRTALEASYRALAREAPTPQARIDYVTKANAVRPWSRT